MGKLKPKLHKNKNYTDTSLHQIYFQKLYEKFLKYYWLNSFKEIAIGLQTTLESLTSFSDGLFV